MSPRRWKKHMFFRSAVLGICLSFFKQVFTIRVAMGAVEIRIAPEASPFRGDAYFEGLGAQKIIFVRIGFFEHMLQKYFPGNFVFGT